MWSPLGVYGTAGAFLWPGLHGGHHFYELPWAGQGETVFALISVVS